MKEFGSLKKLRPRDIWPNEAQDFTPWLASNLNFLGDVLGMDLELTKKEADVGAFSLDLLAQDIGTSRTVIIENQLTPTDHDHLGKLLTYASGYDASVVVWISEVLRDEHRQALEWLNQKTEGSTEFFGLTVEVLQIDESRPVPVFQPVVYPNDWQKGRPNSQPTDKMRKYRDFFQVLIDELRDQHRFTNAKKGQYQSWYSFTSGFPGLTYGVSFAQGQRVRVELYIDTGDKETNKSIFDSMLDEQDAIERDLACSLEWERLDAKRASRIAVYREGSIDMEDDLLKEIRNWAVKYLLVFKDVFGARLGKHLDR